MDVEMIMMIGMLKKCHEVWFEWQVQTKPESYYETSMNIVQT